MGSLESATWGLVFVTGELVLATFLLAYYTNKLVKSAGDQEKALDRLSKAIETIPGGFRAEREKDLYSSRRGGK